MSPDLDITPFVFVYGTLKSGYGNNRLLAGETLCGPVTTRESFVLTNCGFPYLYRASEHTAPVTGELWRISDPDTMMYLDALEGVDFGHYDRQLIHVVDDEGFFRRAWAYVTWPETGSRYPRCGRVNDCYVWIGGGNGLSRVA